MSVLQKCEKFSGDAKKVQCAAGTKKRRVAPGQRDGFGTVSHSGGLFVPSPSCEPCNSTQQHHLAGLNRIVRLHAQEINTGTDGAILLISTVPLQPMFTAR